MHRYLTLAHIDHSVLPSRVVCVVLQPASRTVRTNVVVGVLTAQMIGYSPGNYRWMQIMYGVKQASKLMWIRRKSKRIIMKGRELCDTLDLSSSSYYRYGLYNITGRQHSLQCESFEILVLMCPGLAGGKAMKRNRTGVMGLGTGSNRGGISDAKKEQPRQPASALR